MNSLPDLTPGQLWVVNLPRSSAGLVFSLASRLAVEGPVRILDGGNCFNVYTVARILRTYTTEVDAALRRIQVARAFTCYQVTALLESTPADAQPTLVLDMLATYTDESVSLAERQRLLHRSAVELRRLSRQGRILVSVHPSTRVAELTMLLEILAQAADQVWRLETPAITPAMRLF